MHMNNPCYKCLVRATCNISFRVAINRITHNNLRKFGYKCGCDVYEKYLITKHFGKEKNYSITETSRRIDERLKQRLKEIKINDKSM